MRRTTRKGGLARRPGRRPRVEPLEPRALLATLTVNTAADEDARDGTLSLREAIEVADGTLAIGALSGPEQAQVVATPGVNLIKFDLPGGLASYEIEPSSALPAITAPTVVDGTSQPGYAGKPIVELVGDGVPTLRYGSKIPAYGLSLASAGVTVQGLVIDEFGDAQVGITGPGGDVVGGDYLGTDVSGTVAKPNPYPQDFGNGVAIFGSSHNTIGGTTAADRNVISGNAIGVVVGDTRGAGVAGVSSSNNVIEGNYVGTDVNGVKALINANTGIDLAGAAAAGNTIGGTATGAGNLISEDGPTTTPYLFAAPGIYITQLGGGGNVVEGNTIGLDASRPNAAPDTGPGIVVAGASRGLTIGGITPGAGNVITGSRGDGIEVGTTEDYFPNEPTGIAILGNSIYGNAKLGIDLNGDGVTPNASGVRTGAPNEGQNYPAILSATVASGSTRVVGAINGAPNTIYRVEYFGNPAADPSGYGQGQTFLGATSVTTDGTGNVTFTASLPGDLTGQSLSATATDPAGGTSEFARDFEVGAPPLAATTMTLTSGLNPARQIDAITFTATVAPTGGGTPTGNVLFTIGGAVSYYSLPLMVSVPLRMVNGLEQATYTFTPEFYTTPGGGGGYPQTPVYLGQGLHVVGAAYQGDQVFAPSESAPLSQTVTPDPAIISDGTTPARPTTGKASTLVAIVYPELGGTPTGDATITFRGVSKAVPLVPSTLYGATASLRAAGLPSGHYSYTVAYAGDATHAAANPTTFGFDVSPNYPSVLHLALSTTAAAVGQPVTATVTIPAPPASHLRPHSAVNISYELSLGGTFVARSVPIKIVNGVATATLTVPGLARGRYNFLAAYPGDDTFLPGDEVYAILNVGPGPRVTGLHRFGTGTQPTTLVLNFSEPLDNIFSRMAGNYTLTGPLDASGKGAAIPIASAVYNAKAGTVTLTTAHPLGDDAQALYHLTIRGTLGGLRAADNIQLAGSGGVAGTNYAATFRGGGLPGGAFPKS